MMPNSWRLTYTSRRTCADAAHATAEVAAIQAISSGNNQRAGLFGALVASPCRFAQVLEGPRDLLEATFERICRDTRHDDLLVMSFAPAEERVFSDFRLQVISVDTPPAADPETAGAAMLAQLRASMERVGTADALEPG